MARFIYIAVSVLLVLSCVGLIFCGWDKSLLHGPKNAEFHIVRFDSAVEDYAETGNFSAWQRLNTDYPRELRALVEKVLRLGSLDKESVGDSLRQFYSDPLLKKLRVDVGRKFEDLSPYEREMSEAFSKLSEACPDFVIPCVYVQNSAFNQSVVVGDSLIGISLDKYMGADYPVYKHFFYENQRASMEPKRIVQDCLGFYLMQLYPLHLPEGRTTPNLQERMIHSGMIGWAVAHVLKRSLADVAACQTSTKQWYLRNERTAWQRLSARNMWRSEDAKLIHSVMQSSDASPYFGETHSRGIGFWIGMRIVDSYMRRHGKVNLNELLHEKDYAKILRQSHYME